MSLIFFIFYNYFIFTRYKYDQLNKSLYENLFYFKSYSEDNYYINNSKVCGRTNLGKNFYLSSGLQISDSHQELVKLKLMINLAEYNIISEVKNIFNIDLSAVNIMNIAKFN